MTGAFLGILFLLAASDSAGSGGDAALLTGSVTDEAGNPLIGATVMVARTSTGAMTDAAGTYTILLEEAASCTLSCSIVGMEPDTCETGEILPGDTVHVDFVLRYGEAGFNLFHFHNGTYSVVSSCLLEDSHHQQHLPTRGAGDPRHSERPGSPAGDPRRHRLRPAVRRGGVQQ